MFCAQCGKKVKENMLFCPHCGKVLEFLEDEETAVQQTDIQPQNDGAETARQGVNQQPSVVQYESRAQSAQQYSSGQNQNGESRQNTQRPSFDEDAQYSLYNSPEDAQAFVPIDIDTEVFYQAPEPEVSVFALEDEEEPEMAVVEISGQAPELNRETNPLDTHGSETYLPRKYEPDPEEDFEEGNFFMEEERPAPRSRAYEPEEDFEDYDEDDDFEYEEPQSGSFFYRHIRSLVGFSLFLMVVLIMSMWAVSPNGQNLLAHYSLAWKPSAYEQLAYEAYSAQHYKTAGDYYAKAYQRADDGYTYALYAAISYQNAGQADLAVQYVKHALAVRQDDVKPYQVLVSLYPDVATRPWDVNELVKQGYQVTGDPSLAAE